MLPSELRLNREKINKIPQKDLKQVFNRLGTLKYSTTDKGYSVIVSSKQEKRAVARNKVKRRIYSLFNKEKPTFLGMLYVSKHTYAMEFSEIKDLFYDLLQKASKNT